MNDIIIEFRGTKVLQSEAGLIRALEREIDTEINYIPLNFFTSGAFNLRFTTKENRIVGLSLKNCGIKQFPEILIKFKSLIFIDLMNNLIETLPDTLSTMASLRSLDLTRNRLKKFPEVLTKVKTLMALYLQINLIDEIPYSIGNLTNLIILRLDYNKITHIPETICELKNLKELYIDGNEIYWLPDSLLRLKSLKTLGISTDYLPLELQISVEELKKEFSDYIQKTIPEEKIPALDTYIDDIPRLNIITPPYRIRFFYEYGRECFWPECDNSYIKYGTPIDPYRLPFSQEVAMKFEELSEGWEDLFHYDIPKNQINAKDRENFVLDTAIYLERAVNELGEDIEFCEDHDYYMAKKEKLVEKRISLLRDDNLLVRVVGYLDADITERIMDSDKIIVDEEEVRLYLHYPKKRIKGVNLSNAGGFTRLDLYKFIYEGYKKLFHMKKKLKGIFLKDIIIDEIVYRVYTRSIFVYIKEMIKNKTSE